MSPFLLSATAEYGPPHDPNPVDACHAPQAKVPCAPRRARAAQKAKARPNLAHRTLPAFSTAPPTAGRPELARWRPRRRRYERSARIWSTHALSARCTPLPCPEQEPEKRVLLGRPSNNVKAGNAALFQGGPQLSDESMSCSCGAAATGRSALPRDDAGHGKPGLARHGGVSAGPPAAERPRSAPPTSPTPCCRRPCGHAQCGQVDDLQPDVQHERAR
jgi:hypothetical protein